MSRTVLPRTSVLAVFALQLAFACVLAGCGSSAPVEPAIVSLHPNASGDSQCAMPGQVLKKPLRVIVEGPIQPGMLGGKGSRPPVPGAEVLFEIVDPSSGAVFADNDDTKLTVKTGPAGTAAVRLRLGNRLGDVLVNASLCTSEGVRTRSFRAIGGVEKIGYELEGPTGGTIPCFGVRLADASGAPVQGVDVFFRVEGNGNGSQVSDYMVVTDAEGRAVTSWKLGTKIAQYFASVEIQDTRPEIADSERFNARAIEFEAMGMNKTKMTIELLGGLAVFIFGMNLMSGGLQRMADRRLKSILQAVTRNRLLAVTVGAGLTAVVQSSSATTVMVVGFVNAGLISLGQAIGVIYGANVGTTITAQIIAFKLDALAYPAIAVGLVLMGLARKPHYKHLGETILGFGLLFLGMSTMSGILKPLRYSPDFRSLFQIFDCSPVGGVVPALPALMAIAIGAVATGIIQSSSATVGLILALASQGLISFHTAVPLSLGADIGTTVTAALASLGANRDAKRAALAHTLFNVFGAAYMYVLLFVPLWDGQPVFLGAINAITPGNVFAPSPENLVRHVANAHTAFKVFNCLLFLPFISLMTRLCQKIIPVTTVARESVLEYLEPRLVQTPSLALQQAVKEVGYMVRRAQKSLNESCDFFFSGSKELRDKVLEREDLIDRLQHEITAYLVELSRHTLEPDEAALIPALIHAVNDAERIGDHSEDIVDMALVKEERNQTLSKSAEDDIRLFQGLLNRQFDATIKALRFGDTAEVEKALALEEELNDMLKSSSDAHLKRLETGECATHSGVVFLDLASHLERVGDHLTNIAERAGNLIKVTEV